MSKLLISAFIKLNKREKSANQVALFCLHQTKLVVRASSVTMLPQFSILSIEESLFYISGFDYSKLFNRSMLDESMRLSEERLKTQCANIWSSTFVLQNLQVYKSEVFKQLGSAMLGLQIIYVFPHISPFLYIDMEKRICSWLIFYLLTFKYFASEN